MANQTTIQSAAPAAAPKAPEPVSPAQTVKAKIIALAVLYGLPIFSLPERAGEWVDERSKTVTRRLAYVKFLLGGNPASPVIGSIYSQTPVVGDESVTFAMPKGVMDLRDADSSTVCEANEWKGTVLKAWQEWDSKIAASTTATGKPPALQAPRLTRKRSA